MIPSERDWQRMKSVHNDLTVVVVEALDLFDEAFKDISGARVFVIEGLRTPARQKEMVAIGASTTMNSRHLTGHAVDLGISIGSRMLWEFDAYKRLWEKCVQPAAEFMRIKIEWGGNWKKLRDGPHFQLPFQEYPK